jgi:hypothetical protein
MAPAAPATPTVAPGTARAISLLIVAALTMQVAAILLRTGGAAFPFINYPMYAHPHHEGERIRTYGIHAVFADGSERAVTPQSLPGLSQFHQTWGGYMVALPSDTYTLGGGQRVSLKQAAGLRRWLKGWFSRNASADAYIDAFTRRLEAVAGKWVVRYRIEDYPAVLTRYGYEDAGLPVLLKELNIAHGGDDAPAMRQEARR